MLSFGGSNKGMDDGILPGLRALGLGVVSYNVRHSVDAFALCVASPRCGGCRRAGPSVSLPPISIAIRSLPWTTSSKGFDTGRQALQVFVSIFPALGFSNFPRISE